MTITERIKQEAQSLGFNLVGVIPAKPAKRLDAYLLWLSQDYQGQMAYMSRPDRVQRRTDLNAILPGVKSIVCVSLDYHSIVLPEKIASDPARGRISNYAWNLDYHDIIVPRLEALAGQIVKWTGGRAECKVYSDTGAILERDHAESAGIGFTGKNTMLIAPRRGSYFFLGEILTTAELESEPPQVPMPGCGTCHRCLDACPTDAFPKPYVLDASRCISYLTIEYKSWIPRELRPLMANWIYGCDICQQVCPFNRFSSESSESGFSPANIDSAAPHLVDLLQLGEEAFQARFSRSPIKRIKRRGLVRNACVAAGNWGSEASINPLQQLLNDPEPIIRGHAAWALGRIGTQTALASLEDSLATEDHDDVRQEIAVALEGASREKKKA